MILKTALNKHNEYSRASSKKNLKRVWRPGFEWSGHYIFKRHSRKNQNLEIKKICLESANPRRW